MDTAALADTAFSPAPSTGPRHFLMCAPRYFGVDYIINPWMRREDPVDGALALRQWERLVQAYRDHGHRVECVEPAAGQPDMVYAANGALVLDGIAYLSEGRVFATELGSTAAEQLLGMTADDIRAALTA